ncbi:zinc-ribbon domain-containing protein [Salipiger sp. H15]|uniref:Zinc-ribbon domain-containing protein n=1 Tax=Alloyangia sp. H15 TaxID=3029062 RepID=A0AAU8AI63_9RHOB
MRLICPNCGAQYEVPVDAIPTGGRDVQCSSCGHTWFQLAALDRPVPQEDAEAAAETAPEDMRAPDDLWEEMDEGAEPAPLHAAPEPEPEPESWPEEPAATPVPRRPVRARGLDPSVAEVLRQEAEREARRRHDPEPLESQPELGLAEPSAEDAAHRARVARDHMARIRGDAPLSDAPEARHAPDDFGAPEPEHPAIPVSRRDLLPDIEEINQSLRVAPPPRRMETPQGRALDAEEEEQQGSNFARGFGMMLILAVLAVLLYALAPAITAAVPAMAPLLDPYVAVVDGMRLWLDGQLAALLG